MEDHHLSTKARWDLGVVGVMLAAITLGSCSNSSNFSGLLDAQQAESTASSAQTTAALGSLGLEASLNQIDPTNFAPLSSPPGITTTGTPTSGTVTIDFGAGTQVNGATVAGSLIATYAVTLGTVVAVTVTFSGLTTNTSAGGAVAISGSLTLAANLNSTTNINGTLIGSVTTTGTSDTTTVTPNLTYAIDGTPTTGDITLDGTIGLDSSTYGTWDATLTTIQGTVSQSTRTINSGVLAMDRSAFPPITATMTFTGANTGTIDVSPIGYTKSFTL